MVVGNGESRRDVDLNLFKKDFHIIGCNALHRDFIPDRLICCDRRMAEESTKNPCTKNTNIYVRKDWYHFFRKIKKNKNVKPVPDLPYKGTKPKDDPFNWGSGAYSILIAAQDFDEIYLLGFDLYPTLDLKYNNLYKNTVNYDDSQCKAVDPSYWIYQIAKIFTLFPRKIFYCVNDLRWKMPEQWLRQNVESIDITNFLLTLNNKSI